MAIEEFKGKHSFLSNFHPSKVILDDVEYPTVEHAYQAAKTNDLEARKRFINITAAESKKRGRTVKIRPDWEEVKLSIMKQLITQKFQHKHLRDKLIETRGNKLVEGNWWGDTFWGVCRGEGENHLGKILMEVRDSL